MNDAVAEDLRTFFAETAPEGVLSAYLYGSRFPAELVRKLERLPGLRNVLIHEYVALDLDRVVEALDELEPVGPFLEIVRAP